MTLVPRPIDPDITWWIKTAPTTMPVSVDEVKEFARIDTTAEDALLETMIAAVTEIVQKWLGRALMQQTLIMSFDEWPEDGEISLPRPPLISITQVRSLDEDDVITEFESSNYFVRSDLTPATVILRSDTATITTNTDRYCGGWEIEFVAGYGTEPEDVPAAIRAGIMAWTTEFYETRVLTDEPPKGVFALLNMEKIPRF